MDLQAEDTILETERLLLRELRATDLEDMAELLGDPEGMQHYPRPKTRDEAQQWIDWNLGLYAMRGFGLWAVLLKSTGEFVGDCGLTPQEVEGVEEIEIGYHVKRSYWRRGYAVEAAVACCAYG
ncbi:MAG: GNAT family N-acetyltransferase, partial [Candidatus Dormibacteraceae bacterium]